MKSYNTVKIPLPKYLSHTSCEVMDQCSLHFLFTYRMHLKKEGPVADYGVPGRTIHNTITKTFEKMKRIDIERIIDPHEFFEEIVKIAFGENKEKIEDEKDKVIIKTCLDNYINLMTRRFNYFADDHKLELFLPNEYEISLKNNISEVPFKGRLDAVFMNPQVRLTEWKSSSRNEITEDQIRQVIRYVVLYEHENHIKPSDCFIFNLRESVKDLRKCQKTITDTMIETEEQHVKSIWEKACGSVFEKSKSDASCFFCGYKTKCENSPDIINIQNELIPKPIYAFRSIKVSELFS